MMESNFEILKQRMIGAAPAFAQKIAPIYQVLNWSWIDLDSYPTEDQIHDHIVELIYQLSDDVLFVSSGGIKVSIDEDEGFPIGRLAMDIETEISL
jgi:hypothetical protein